MRFTPQSLRTCTQAFLSVENAPWCIFVQTFGNYSTIGNISVPYIGFKGTQDDLLGGQEEDVFAKLSPSTANESTLITFDGASGGALHCAVGSPYLQAARQFGALNSIVSFNRLPSNVTSTTASAGR